MASGLRVFLEFAGPCLKIRKAAGLIDEKDFNDAKFLVSIGAEPTLTFLRRCFPKAVAKFEATGGKIENEKDVRAFWHQHQGLGECRIRQAKVEDIWGEKALVSCNFGHIEVANPCGFPLAIGCTVFLHQKSIVESSAEREYPDPASY